MGIKITDLTALATAPNIADVIAIVDVSDTTQALSGTTKKITIADLGFLSSGDNITELTNNAGYITSSDFSNGGELAGADRDLGNTDAFALSFITNGVGRINIEAGGNVGIGTSTPSEKLEVVGNAKVTSGNIELTQNISTISLHTDNVTAGSGNGIRARNNGSYQGMSYSSYNGEHWFGTDTFGLATTGTTLNTNRGILRGFAEIESDITSLTLKVQTNDLTDRLLVQTRDAAHTTYIDRFSILGGAANPVAYFENISGLGIGTATPTEKLEVVGNALITGTTGNTFRTVGSLAESLRIQSDGNAYFSNTVNNKLFYFGDNGRIQAKVASGNAQLQQFDLFNCGLNNAFAGNNQTINNVNRLSVGSSFVVNSAFSVNGTASGLPYSTFQNVNVGIGTTTPTEKLEVVGNIKASLGGNISTSGNSTSTQLVVGGNSSNAIKSRITGNVGTGSGQASGLFLDALPNSGTTSYYQINSSVSTLEPATLVSVYGSARNGSSVTNGVQGVVSGGMGQASSNFTAGVRGANNANLGSTHYGGYFTNNTNVIGATAYGVRGTVSTVAANQTRYGGYFSVTGSGTGAQSIGLYATATGAATNYAIKSDGNINMTNLPTSSAGLSAGDLWNNAGVINIV